jgi:hypothetical protein
MVYFLFQLKNQSVKPVQHKRAQSQADKNGGCNIENFFHFASPGKGKTVLPMHKLYGFLGLST